MKQVKTTISLQGALLEESDSIAKELHIPRSRVFSFAMEEFIRRYRNKKLLAQINDAYATPPNSDENENFEIMRSRQKRLAESGDEWK
jgi:metal-responsive CopG/Arc/MetJ family transcriptional regulator